MAHVPPLDRDDLPELADQLALTEQFMGFLPNSLLTMARVPGLVQGFGALAGTVLTTPLLSQELIQLVAHVASTAGGCRYCQAHTSHNAHRAGASEDKLRHAWEFETDDRFTEAERAALRIAEAGGSSPNGATPELFDAARLHWSDDELAAIVAVVSLFGYLNRWNDTMATDLEDVPTEWATRIHADQGWTGERHGR